MKCTKCGQEKDITNFYKSKKDKYGVHSWCKECALKEKQGYYINNKEKIKKYKQLPHNMKKSCLRQKDYTKANKETWRGFIPEITQRQVCGKDIYFLELKGIGLFILTIGTKV
jgi:hypothetical protein